MTIANILNPASRLYNAPDVPKLSRDNDLDLLRFLLAACVVFYHSKTLVGGLDFAFARVSAVPVFLFLSGLLITESFYGTPTLKTYVEKRVRRIYPGYLVVVLVGGLLAFIGWRVLGDQQTTISGLLKYWASNSVFANWITPCVVSETEVVGQTCAVNGSLWVIKWEVLFYALLPLILIFFSRFGKILCALLLVLLAARVSFEPSPYIRIFLCFLMGICTYYLKPIWIPALKKLPPAPPLLRQAVLLASFLLATQIYYGPFIILLMFIAFYPTSEGWTPNIMKFGDISYGVFLIHFPLITAIFQFLPPSMFGPWVSFVVLAVSTLLSIILYKFVEERFLLPSSYYRKKHEASKVQEIL